MALYYFDTSALVKLYVAETGSAWLRRLVAPRAGHDIHTGRLTGPELIAALFGKARANELPAAEAGRLTGLFRLDWQSRYRVLEVTPAVADRAMDVAERHNLRGYDAVHLAAALALQAAYARRRHPPLTFVSADDAQLRAAGAEGLLVENPNWHR